MFEFLNNYKRIFVCGIHRSGTRIASKMIADDTWKPFIDETLIWDSWLGVNSYETWIGSCVYHCPLLVPDLRDNVRDNDCVVWVSRSTEDIRSSMGRIEFTISTEEDKKWREKASSDWKQIEDSLKMRLEVWKKFIEPSLICNVVEVPYASLIHHPLWKTRDERKDFAWHQTQNQNYQDWPDVLNPIMEAIRG